MSETATAVRSALTWFEIPCTDFDRARRFYETILETPLPEHAFHGARIAIFPHAQDAGVGGCIDAGSDATPGATGVVIYLDVDGRLDRTLELVPSAGGRIVSPKATLPEIGHVAHVIDSEGNRIGLHAKS